MDNATLISEISTLPDHLKDEVVDFVQFLKQKLKKMKASGSLNSPSSKTVNRTFTVIHVEPVDYKFNRDEANER